jgi:hypothetical protein
MQFDPHELFFNDLDRYWHVGSELLRALPLQRVTLPEHEPLPPRMALVRLPEWGSELGIDGHIPLPAHLSPGVSKWEDVDWPLAGFWYLHGLAERAFEKKHGPIHSYAFRLKGWDERLWSHAWVNRIALFLRRWGARNLQKDEVEIFGPLPEPEIIFTHDVDAVRKTTAIRCKQSAFHLINAGRSLLEKKASRAKDKFAQAVRFFFSNHDYWCFDQLISLEKQYGVRSCFNIYGGVGRHRSLKQRLFDPSYDVLEPKLTQQLQRLHQGGWTIGLHQSYDAWANAGLMREEKDRLEKALNVKITTCRQHWLRFSWEHTWQAQQEAGLELDTTLGFNDRPGFRNGAALRFHPLDLATGQAMKLQSLPLVLMDSHLYDYLDFDDEQRAREIKRWIDEIRHVHGAASVLWHPQALSSDYGWDCGFKALLEFLRRKNDSQGCP